MLESTIKQNLNAILKKVEEISTGAIKQIFIAENKCADEHGVYIKPYSIIIDTNGIHLGENKTIELRDFLKTTLNDARIAVCYKHFLEEDVKDNNAISIDSQHMLVTAIDINDVNPIKPWQEQFSDKKKIAVGFISSTENEAQKRKYSETEINPTSELLPKSESESKKSRSSGAGGNSPYREQEEMLRQNFLKMYHNLTQEDVNKIQIHFYIPNEIAEKINVELSQKKDPKPFPQPTSNRSMGATNNTNSGQRVI